MAGFSVNVGANTAELAKGMAQAKSLVQGFLDSFDEAAAGAAAMDRLSKSIDESVASALAAGQTLSGTFQAPIKSIDQLEKEIDELEAKIRKTTNLGDFKRLAKEANDLQRQLSNLKVVGYEKTLDGFAAAGSRAAGGLNATTKASGAAFGALTGVNRVIQDSAYGFNGIANNLQELPALFRSLSVAAKESGQSVGKLVVGQLLGVGGLSTAVSLITTALTFATIGFGAWTRGLGGAGAAAKKAKDETKEFEDTIKSINQSVAEEVSRVNILINFIGRETTSRKERTAAIKELQSIAPQYFSQLNAEKTTVDELSKAYTAFSNNIQASIRARVFSEQLKKITEERIALEDDINNKGDKQIVINGRLVAARQFDLRSRKEQLADQGRLLQLRQDEETLIKRINDLQKPDVRVQNNEKGRKEEDAQLKALKSALDGYQKQLQVTNQLREAGLLPIFRENDALELQLKILKTINAIDAREVAIKAKPELEIDPVLGELQITRAFNEFGTRSRHKPVEIPLYVAPKIKIDVQARTGSDVIDPSAFDSVINDVLKKARMRLQDTGLRQALDLGENIQQIIKTGAVDMVSGLGESLGEALASGDLAGGLRKAGQGMLGVLGSVMQQIGREVIAAAIKIKLLKEALTKWAVANPALAITAGIGLIAAGAALRNIKFDGPKFANGGIVTGPVIGQIGEMHRPEVIMPLDRLPQMLGAIDKGGSGGWQLIPIVNNDGLYLAMKRGERSVGRKF